MSRPLALACVLICAMIWGTTWYAITLQLGTVDTVASVTYRFGLAAAVIFAGCLVTGRSLKMTRAQHLALMGQGLFVFTISYAFVYWSEERVASAVVAVIFAALAFLNLVLFRVVAGQKAAPMAWAGAGLGIVGVGVLFGSELARSGMDQRALIGLLMALTAVCASTVGNIFAWKAQTAAAPVIPATAWAMAYGTLFLAVFGLVSGVDYTFELTARYVLSLLHLSMLGSVVAFLLYFTLARARGYALASYISALTPPVAMLVSVLFEGATFGPLAFAGLALVLAGQMLLIKAPRRSAA